MIYFDSGRADGPRQLAMWARIETYFDAWSDVTLLLFSVTDTVGTPEANLELSKRRAEWVGMQAASRGAPLDQIRITACGESVMNRPTPDNRAEPLNRSVVIDWIPNDSQRALRPSERPGCVTYRLSDPPIR